MVEGQQEEKECMKLRTVSISINRDPRTVYEFILNLEDFPRRASTDFRRLSN